MLGYLDISIIHRTLTWTTGSLTCVCDLFACVYTRGTSIYSLIRMIFATEFDSGETSGRAQSLARNGHPSVWSPRSIVFHFGFRERAGALALHHWLSHCSAPLTVPLLCTTDCPTALHHWLSHCSAPLTVPLLCTTDCPTALRHWLSHCSAPLTVPLLCATEPQRSGGVWKLRWPSLAPRP